MFSSNCHPLSAALSEFGTPLGPRTAKIPYSDFRISKVNCSGAYRFSSLIFINAVIVRGSRFDEVELVCGDRLAAERM